MRVNMKVYEKYRLIYEDIILLSFLRYKLKSSFELRPKCK